MKEMPNNAIVFSDDDDEKSYCDDCSYLLIERKDGSMRCSNPDCGRQYSPDSVNKHKRKLRPDKSPYDGSDVPLVSMTEYGSYAKKKKQTILDKEEKAFVAARPGRSIINVEEWLPEEDEHR